MGDSFAIIYNNIFFPTEQLQYSWYTVASGRPKMSTGRLFPSSEYLSILKDNEVTRGDPRVSVIGREVRDDDDKSICGFDEL